MAEPRSRRSERPTGVERPARRSTLRPGEPARSRPCPGKGLPETDPTGGGEPETEMVAFI